MAEGKTIAIIDDDLASVEVLLKFLRKAGHHVHYFYDGLSGFDFVRNARPDLVVSDMLLPKLHGLDLCRRIKAHKQLCRIPVVLMTGVYRDPRHKSEVTDAGADAFFTKPFDLARTINTLQEMMGEGAVEVVHDEVKEELEHIAKAYLVALPGKLTEIDLLLERLVSKKGSRDALAYLHLQVHALAGSSATFGFNQLSKWAAAASGYLKSLLDRKADPGEAEFEKIQTFLAEMRLNAPTPDQPALSEKLLISPDLLQGPADSKRRLIFLVEPNLGLANELTLELELFGFMVRCFSAEAELQAYRGEAPDALVMAFEMPEGQLVKVRNNPILHTLPLIFLSAESDINARLTAVRVGGDAFLPKPLDTGTLVNKVHEMTHLRRTSPLRVLLISGNREEGESMARILGHAEMVVKVSEPLLVMETLSSFSPDMLIVDTDLTGCSGVELVRLIHQDDTFLGIAIIFITSSTNPLEHDAMLGEGADDVLVKPVKPGMLVARVTHRGKRFRGLRSHMVRDGLTGLLNPTSVLLSLTVELERVRRRNGDLSIAIFDIDHLNRLNEMIGHVGGNTAIRGLAGMLSRRLRNTDLVGRYEGPSILVVFPDTTGEQAKAVVNGISRDFARVLQHVDATEFYATFSCGIASYPLFKDHSAMLVAAQDGLEAAKKLGGNRVTLQS